MKISAHLASRQRGLATVEMAFVTPVLLIILLVTFEFTRAFYQRNTLTKSVRDAARLLSTDAFTGSVFKVTDADIEDAKNLAVYGNIAGTGLPVITGLTRAHFTYAETGDSPQEHVQMSVSYPFQALWPIIPIDGKDISALTLTATSSMRALK